MYFLECWLFCPEIYVYQIGPQWLCVHYQQCAWLGHNFLRLIWRGLVSLLSSDIWNHCCFKLYTVRVQVCWPQWVEWASRLQRLWAGNPSLENSKAALLALHMFACLIYHICTSLKISNAHHIMSLSSLQLLCLRRKLNHLGINHEITRGMKKARWHCC